jgi:hypothetical protein
MALDEGISIMLDGCWMERAQGGHVTGKLAAVVSAMEASGGIFISSNNILHPISQTSSRNICFQSFTHSVSHLQLPCKSLPANRDMVVSGARRRRYGAQGTSRDHHLTRHLLADQV